MRYRWPTRGLAIGRLAAAWIASGIAGVGAARGADEGLQYGPVPEFKGTDAATPVQPPERESASAARVPSAGVADTVAPGSEVASESRPLGGVAATTQATGGVAAGLGDTSPLGPTLVALAGVVALIVIVLGCARLGRGRCGVLSSHRAPSGLIEVLGRYPMAGGPTLLLLRADRRVLLLAQGRASRLGGATLATLAEFGDVDEVASILAQARDARDESISARFGSLLSAFSAEHATGSEASRIATGSGASDELVEVRVVDADAAGDGHGAARLRRRLEGVRVWEGAIA